MTMPRMNPLQLADKPRMEDRQEEEVEVVQKDDKFEYKKSLFGQLTKAQVILNYLHCFQNFYSG